MKFNELGRSMVEMLGVLAIIGVLSVGAIAGYSKAMMKYKLNKHAYQMSQLINTIHIYQYQLHYDTKNRLSLIPIFQKLNLIPEGMKIVNSNGSTYLQDSFGSYNAIDINSQPYNDQTILTIYGTTRAGYYNVDFYDYSSAITYCYNILSPLQEILKENKNNLCYIRVPNTAGGISINSLINVSPSEINNICKQSLEENQNQIFFSICFNNKN